MNFDSERIDIAVDPFTGRNPSYCFVDLRTKEHAERAMTELDGHDMLGRPVRIKPGVAKSSERPAEQTRTPVAMSRWRPSEGSSTNNPTTSTKVNGDASQRVYVGGLPRLTEPESVQANMRTFFQGYNVYVASKILEIENCPSNDLQFLPSVLILMYEFFFLVKTSARCSPHTPQRDSSPVTTTICLWI